MQWLKAGWQVWWALLSCAGTRVICSLHCAERLSANLIIIIRFSDTESQDLSSLYLVFNCSNKEFNTSN